MANADASWCEDAGCRVTIDRLGSIFARRAGEDETLAPVLIGSHLDTQVAGGKYDGILGVLAGLEVVRTLNDGDLQTHRPVEVVCWTNEEGARFQPPMMCSGAFAGVHDVDWILDCQDDDGCVFGEELARIGYDGSAPVGGRDIDAYFELHIEQGPELEEEGIPLGIVSGGYFTRGMVIEVEGENAHAGPTPMDKRKNALVKSAAEELQVRYQEMLSQAGHDAYHMTRVTPTALLFSPCRQGITHNENEHIEPEYTIPAVNVLLHSVLSRANR